MDLTKLGLGLLAGGTIFLGLPVARLQRLSTKTKAFLNAASTGVLVFLLVEVSGHVLEGIEELIRRAATGQPGLRQALQLGGLFVVGFSIGLLGLVWFEQRFLGSAKDAPVEKRSKQVAAMIAIGLGLHNFTEGLAIGQGFASGALQLAWLLAIGFALHNATEGFGIAAPLSGQQVRWGYLTRMGLIAGGPTVLGAVLGGWWTSKPIEVFTMALASGTILYVVGELLHLGRRLKEESIVAVGLLVGFFVAVAADFVLVGVMERQTALASQQHLQSQAAPGVVDIYSPELHKPRHGGTFGDADDQYHYEVLINGQGQLVLYVNDEFNRPIDVRHLQGHWTLNPDDRSPTKGNFIAAPDGAYFFSPLPANHANPMHVEVNVIKGRQWVSMEFFVPIAGTNSLAARATTAAAP